MSSSDPNSTANPARWGRVFMGPDTSRESTIDKILNAQERELWNRSTEIEYLKRVREKAASDAQSIMEKAQARNAANRAAVVTWAEGVKARAEQFYAQAMQEREQARQYLREAEAIRNQAHEEGFQTGLKSAEAVIAQHEFARDSVAASIVSRIQEQCAVIFEAWRQELTALARETVETTTGLVLREEYAAILEQTLEQSVKAMEGRQSLRARVNPEDAELVQGMLGRVQAQLGVERWDVQPDPAVEPGGIILENEAGRVDALPSTRRAIVEEVLARMGVPYSAVDDAALAAVAAPIPELTSLMTPPPSPEAVLPPPIPDLPPMAEAAVPDFSDGPHLDTNMDVLGALEELPLQEAEPQPFGDADGYAREEAEPSDLSGAPDTLGAAEHMAMERAAEAMDKALGGNDSLPDDVAAYIMDAVADPVEPAAQDAAYASMPELDLSEGLDLDLELSAPESGPVAELPEGLDELLGSPDDAAPDGSAEFVDAGFVEVPDEVLPEDDEPQELGGGSNEIGGGSLELGGGPLELGGTRPNLGLQELDLGDD